MKLVNKNESHKRASMTMRIDWHTGAEYLFESINFSWSCGCCHDEGWLSSEFGAERRVSEINGKIPENDDTRMSYTYTKNIWVSLWKSLDSSKFEQKFQLNINVRINFSNKL